MDAFVVAYKAYLEQHGLEKGDEQAIKEFHHSEMCIPHRQCNYCPDMGAMNGGRDKVTL